MKKTRKTEMIKNSVPACDWAEGYPIGNGRLGAMVVSRGESTRLSLNHDLLWRDFVKFRKSNTKNDIEEIKSLCREGKYNEAEQVLFRTQPVTGRAVYINPFVPAADLYITTPHVPDTFARALILDEGCAIDKFSSGGVDFERRSFASASDGVILTRLTANRGAWLDGDISLSRIDDLECAIESSASCNTLELYGSFEEGVHFCVTAKVYSRGGKLMAARSEYTAPPKTSRRVFSTEYIFSAEDMYSPAHGIGLSYTKSDEIIIAVFISTDAESVIHSLSPTGLNRKKLTEFENKYIMPENMWDIMYAAHKAEYSKIYGQQRLCLCGGDDGIDNESLLNECGESGEVDPRLAQRLFAMARYLCVTSGMPQKESEISKAPINLQGLWNRDLYPAWDCDYHTDLNLAMCYWPMDQLGLGVCINPLMDWIERIMPQAGMLADDLYGCKGIALNGCCDYKTIGRTDNVGYFWLGAAAWLADILWQHYEYTGDTVFLRERLLPFMKGIADFFADILEEHDGYLMPPFGASPEFAVKRDGGNTFVHSASNIDIELIYALFSHLEACCSLFGCYEESERNRDIFGRLPLPKIKNDGMMSEFYDTGYVESEPGHRHRSPLVGLCPGNRISYGSTPEYADAALKLIEHRMKNGKSSSQAFAYAWDMQLLARLGEAEQAYRCLCSYSKIHLLPNLLSTGNDWTQKHGGLAWFTGQRVFQIEACISTGAGILELFFDSRQGIMEFLPALPSAYLTGSIENVAAKGGFEVSFSWSAGMVNRIYIKSNIGGQCKIMLSKRLKISALPVSAVVHNGIVRINTEKGGVIEINCM
ncbi:MAG: glycoside hydrolase N-terminal domain-containing protein [Eubacteriales bacterium]|nr:glycoside hydrolase N-terminal domain-containing protein [Eubacteriales bacterium]